MSCRRDLQADLDLLKVHRKRVKDRIQWLKKQDDLDMEMIRRLRNDQSMITACMARIRKEIVDG